MTIKLTVMRLQNGWSKAELARRSRMDAALISKIESGRIIPYPCELTRIAHALGVKQNDSALLLTAASVD